MVPAQYGPFNEVYRAFLRFATCLVGLPVKESSLGGSLPIIGLSDRESSLGGSLSNLSSVFSRLETSGEMR